MDKDGNFIITGNVSFDRTKRWLARADVPYRGTMFRVNATSGKIEVIANDLRPPAGLFVHLKTGELFYTENQGDWMGSGGITHIEQGDFVGNPASLEWAGTPYSPNNLTMNDIVSVTGMAQNYKNMDDPTKLGKYGKPLPEIAKKFKGLKTQAVVLPHSVMGQSTSDILYLEEDNGFAPHFAGQLLIGDQAQSKLVRVSLEKIDGVYQGAAFGVLEGYKSGVLRMTQAFDKALYVGMTSRG